MSARVFCLFACLSLGASALAVPPTPESDPSGNPKNRYLSMSVPSNGGEPMALRVTLVSLHLVVPPYTGQLTPPPFSSFEGQYRWVGPPVFSTESDADLTPFVAAPLQCTPYYHDWSTLGLFHVFGDAVITSSSYAVATLDQSCMGAEEGCADLSPPLNINTSRFGDVIGPFNPPSPAVQPDVADCGAVINKAMRRLGGQSKASMQLQGRTPDPTRTVNVWDCLMAGNGFGGGGYHWGEPSSCESSRNSSTDSSMSNDASVVIDPTLKVFVTPVPAQGTSTYPLGTQIVGQELVAPTGGFRAFFHVQLQDYNPSNTDPFLRGFQIQVDAVGMQGVNANPPIPNFNIVLPQEACAGHPHCQTLFGESGARCEANQCTAAFITLDDWIFAGTENFRLWSVNSPMGPIVGGGRTRGFDDAPIDEGTRKYAGTLVLEIPPEAAGHVYTLNVRQGSETMAVAGDWYSTPLLDTPIAQLTPAIIRVGVQSDATGINRSRFISFVPGHSGEQMAIRVNLVSLHHVNPPYTGGPSVPFTSFEGEYRWVGPPTQYEESTSNNVPFFASSLQCTPHYQDWSSAGYLHVTGSAVVPSSQYEVQFVPASCMGNEDACAEISAPITLATTRWGDVEAQFNPPSATVQPDVADISALVNKFRSAPGAPIKARSLLAGAPGNPSGEITDIMLSQDLGFSHISACVDAFRGVPYPYSGPEACP